MSSFEALLQTAAGSGEIVTVVYNAGSRPGQPRKVLIVSAFSETMTVVEPGNPQSKSYKMNRVASIALPSGEIALNSAVEALPRAGIPDHTTLAAYADAFRAELQAAGWHVYENEISFSVATFQKNGKPKKKPSASIQFMDRTVETVFDPDTGELKTVPRVLTGRERPWRVDSVRLSQGKSLSQLRQAMALFMDEVRGIHSETKIHLNSAK
ncbi:hypothetical protein HSX11_02485 [Oxalobacteraceae bacterium]|nr:hypothetical protein [Oxalobacteraceae bacterium]